MDGRRCGASGGAVPLIAGQLVFAYGFDLLLGWSRRDAHRLGFGPVPVIFSINLFLWFTDDWFHFQFLLVAIGFAAKELIRWERDGRLVHIFNPASFPLAVFALALIVTGMSDVTRAQDIAISQFYPLYPPQMYLWIFLIALPGQYLFGVTTTTMTMAAVVSTFGLLYFAATGVYFFYDSYIPIAVFLGMHLLFTDPSTSPRTELGRIAFGVLYGLSTVALYVVLGRVGAPTFYDKLLQVPLLNLSVIVIDRAARSAGSPAVRPGGAPALAGAAAAASGVHGGVGHRVRGDQRGPGRRGPASRAVGAVLAAGVRGRAAACVRLLVAKQAGLCNMGSGWACNEAGVLQAGLAGAGVVGDQREGGGQAEALFAFQRGCELGFEAACGNYRAMLGGGFRLSARRPRSTTIRSSSGAARGKSPTGSPRSCTPGPAGKGGSKGGWTPAGLSGDDQEQCWRRWHQSRRVPSRGAGHGR